MGAEFSVYVGPYIWCQNERVIRSHAIERACPRPSCAQYARSQSGHKFCPTCGAEIRPVTVERETDAVDSREIAVELLKESLCAWPPNAASPDKGVQIYRSNCGWRKRGKRKMFFDRGDESMEVPIQVANGSTEIVDEMNVFAEFHAADIAALREHYPKVEVRWGILTVWW